MYGARGMVYDEGMKDSWKKVGRDMLSCFSLTLAERRFLLGVVLIFALGMLMRVVTRETESPAAYTPPKETKTAPWIGLR